MSNSKIGVLEVKKKEKRKKRRRWGPRDVAQEKSEVYTRPYHGGHKKSKDPMECRQVSYHATNKVNTKLSSQYA